MTTANNRNQATPEKRDTLGSITGNSDSTNQPGPQDGNAASFGGPTVADSGLGSVQAETPKTNEHADPEDRAGRGNSHAAGGNATTHKPR